MNIKKGDTVKIISGKDRGKTGKVLQVFPQKNRLTVEGVNIYKKHIRPKRQGKKGEIIEVPRPLDRSNVSIICPSCGKPTRLGKKKEEKSIIRHCKKCGNPIE